MRYSLHLDFEVDTDEQAEAFSNEIRDVIETGTDADATLIDTTLRREW